MQDARILCKDKSSFAPATILNMYVMWVLPGSNKMHTNCSQEDEDQDKSYFILPVSF